MTSLKVRAMANKTLDIGVVQTSLDATAAWITGGSGGWQSSVKISLVEERRAMNFRFR